MTVMYREVKRENLYEVMGKFYLSRNGGIKKVIKKNNRYFESIHAYDEVEEERYKEKGFIININSITKPSFFVSPINDHDIISRIFKDGYITGNYI